MCKSIKLKIGLLQLVLISTSVLSTRILNSIYLINKTLTCCYSCRIGFADVRKNRSALFNARAISQDIFRWIEEVNIKFKNVISLQLGYLIRTSEEIRTGNRIIYKSKRSSKKDWEKTYRNNYGLWIIYQQIETNNEWYQR